MRKTPELSSVSTPPVPAALTLLRLFIYGVKTGGIKAFKYGYFAPIQAALLAVQRKGGYFLHLRALYRLCFGKPR